MTHYCGLSRAADGRTQEQRINQAVDRRSERQSPERGTARRQRWSSQAGWPNDRRPWRRSWNTPSMTLLLDFGYCSVWPRYRTGLKSNDFRPVLIRRFHHCPPRHHCLYGRRFSDRRLSSPQSAVMRCAETRPRSRKSRCPEVSYWSIVTVPEYVWPCGSTVISSRMFARPTKQLAAPGSGTHNAPVLSQLNPKWFNLYVRPPSACQTPRQKLLVAGSRPEFMISVPSLCHCA